MSGVARQEILDATQRVVLHRLEGTTSVVCALVLRNGHVVVGEAHCAPGVEFNPELGVEYARADAERKVGELLAFQSRGAINRVLQ